MRHHCYKKNAFTLIELLVVVAIITVFASVSVAQVNVARSHARNAERKETLRRLQVYLELFKEKKGKYPDTGSNWYSSEPDDAPGGLSNNGGNWIPNLAPEYLPSLPRDPLGTLSTISPQCKDIGRYSAYLYRSDGLDYALLAHCSPEGPMLRSDPFYDSLRSSWAWKVCTPRACSWI